MISIPALVTRLGLALVLAAGWSAGARAADDSVSTIVVKFRNDLSTPASARSLPLDARQTLAAALRTGFTETNRTRDGAFTLAFDSPLPFADARAAINRVRELASVLYANIVATPGDAPAVAPRRIGTDQLIVKYRDPALISAARAGLPPGQAKVDRLTAVLGEAVRFGRVMSGDAYVFRLSRRMAPEDAEAAAAKIALEPDVEYAQPDRIMQHHLVPNDTRYSEQWDLYEPVGGINAPNGWNTTTGSVSVVAADLDTGFTNHPDLAGRFVSNGYDFIYDHLVANDNDPVQPGTCLPTSDPNAPPCISSRDADAHDPGDWITAAEDLGTDPTMGWFAGCAGGGGASEDSSWHGTHTAGTIAAAANNAAGVAGINWTSKILPVRVLGKCGGYTSDIVDAIVWVSGGSVAGVPANANPARVMNMSFGGYLGAGHSCPVDDVATQTAINTALANGTALVVSAGNSNTDAFSFTPAGCNGVITVAATGRIGRRAFYSNYGTTVEIAAPGGEWTIFYDPNSILSTLNDGTTTPNNPIYQFYQGTSMAAPHVTGVVSLMMGVNPALTPAQVTAKLQGTARRFPTGSTRDCTNDPAKVTSAVKYCGAGILDMAAAICAAHASGCGTSRMMPADGSSLNQTFTAYPETRWFTLGVEPGKTYVVEAADVNDDLTANAIGTLGIYDADGVSAPAEASVDCTGANGPRPPAVDVAGDGIRCVLRTALPTAGMQQNQRPVYVKVTRLDPVAGGGAQFRIRAREATLYGRWLTTGNNFHVEVENTTAEAMCVEVTRYPAGGLSYTAGPGWSGAVVAQTLTIPAFGADKLVFPSGSLVGGEGEGALRVGACAAPVNLVAAGLHVSTYAFDPLANRYIYFFTTSANDGKTRSTW